MRHISDANYLEIYILPAVLDFEALKASFSLVEFVSGALLFWDVVLDVVPKLDRTSRRLAVKGEESFAVGEGVDNEALDVDDMCFDLSTEIITDR